MVEQSIGEHPDVAECAVVGVDSAFTEQEIHAFVVAKQGANLDTAKLAEFLTGRLPAFMVPKFWSVVEGLPRTPTQRIRKVELRQMAESQQKPK
jgi:crotonobetaine/carnitine-CoA ligase